MPEALTTKLKDWAVIAALVMSGVTGKVSYSNHQLSIEVEKKEKQIAAMQQSSSEFSLAGLCD